jgi:hypothetical protein
MIRTLIAARYISTRLRVHLFEDKAEMVPRGSMYVFLSLQMITSNNEQCLHSFSVSF